MSTTPDRDGFASLFARARRQDARTTPTFEAVLERPPRTHRCTLPALATASVLATGLAGAVLLLRQEPRPPDGAAGQLAVALSDPKPAVSAGRSNETAVPPVSEPLPERVDRLSVLGYVGAKKEKSDVASAPAYAMASPPTESVHDLPAPGRFYQTVIPISRERDLKAVVSGVSNKDPLTGGFVHVVGKTGAVEVAEGSPGLNTERYQRIAENDFLTASENPLSTFSIDVDTASYSVVRRYLTEGRLPPKDAVRIEELLNYFPYAYPAPTGDAPFSVSVEIASCPWSPTHRLARIGLQGEQVQRQSRAGTNLVFLVDVSGSMQTPDKLPLLKSALQLLVDQLGGSDEVAIVVYAGASGLVLPSTPGSQKNAILLALDGLTAGGGTNGGEGLRLAYKVAREHFVRGGVNRVILATDGDFNVGVTDHAELIRLVEEQARAGVALTTLGFGLGNYKDDTLELLADKGNGNHFYIDDEKEARKVLVEQIGGTLVTIAKDVKIQVEFNPRVVGAYRLLGYENRLLKKEDFNDDRKDAGEIGSGHNVTALYELVPPGEAVDLPRVDPLKYQTPASPGAAPSGETLTVKLRYKEPDGDASRLLTVPVTDGGAAIGTASSDLRFAASVAAFGLVLRDSSHKASASLDLSAKLAQESLGADPGGYRRDFLGLVERARTLGGQGISSPAE